jgi:hypothetical protein
VQDPAFSTLLYRYFFFGWLFKDISTGNLFERAAAVRHNREQARWLPTYMLRWLWCGLLFYALGGLVELAVQESLLATLLYAVSSLTLPFHVAIGAAWVTLRGLHWPV